jgi:hypothetical protein
MNKNITCPICGDTTYTFIFRQKIYVVDAKSNVKLGELYGCTNCNIAFTKSEPVEKPKSSDDTINKVQNIFGNISKGCSKVLDNIK